MLGLHHAAEEIARRLQRKHPELPPQRRRHHRDRAAGGGRPRAAARAAAPLRRPQADRRGRAGPGLHGPGSPAGRHRGAQDPVGGPGRQQRPNASPSGASCARPRPRAACATRTSCACSTPTSGPASWCSSTCRAARWPRRWPARERLEPAAARRLALELLSALAAAHAAGIVHRDVKPANIFFDAAGNAKLADFGAAHLADFGGTQTAGFIGTLAYLSPEQITGGRIGPAADLYALGVTLFEALTGRLPFLGPDLVGQHLAETPPAPSAIDPSLSAAHDQVLLLRAGQEPRRAFRLGRADGRGDPRLARGPAHRPARRPGRRRPPTTAAPAPPLAPAERKPIGTHRARAPLRLHRSPHRPAHPGRGAARAAGRRRAGVAAAAGPGRRAPRAAGAGPGERRPGDRVRADRGGHR